MTTRMFDVSDLARALRVTKRTVRRWIAAGHVEAIRTPTGRLRVTSEEFSRVCSAHLKRADVCQMAPMGTSAARGIR